MNLKRMQASYKTLLQLALAPLGGVRDDAVVRALAFQVARVQIPALTPYVG